MRIVNDRFDYLLFKMPLASSLVALMIAVCLMPKGLVAESQSSRTSFIKERLERYLDQSVSAPITPAAGYQIFGPGANLAKSTAQGIQVNTSTAPATFTQSYPDIAAFADGSALAVWEDERNGDWDIFVQMIAADATPSGANLNPITDPDFHDQRQPRVAVNMSDVALLVWTDATSGGIFGMIFDNSLGVIASPFQISDAAPGTLVNMPSVAPLSGDRFIVVWEDTRSGADIFAQLVGGDGMLHGSNFQINDDGAAAYRIAPDVVSSFNGDLAVVWEEPTGGNADIMLKLFTDVGTELFPAMQIGSSHAAAVQVMPAVSHLGNGNYLVGWISDRYGEQSIWAQRITDSGTEVDTTFRINDNSDNISWDLSFTQTSSGGVAAVWADYSGSNSIKLQQIDLNGDLIGGNQILEESGLLRERNSPQGTCTSSGCRVVWNDKRDNHFDIYLQSLDETFAHIGDNILLNDDPSGAQQLLPDVAILSANISGIVWTDERNDAGDIYCRLVARSGSMITEELRVNDDVGSALQSQPRIAGNLLTKGVIVWSDSRVIAESSNQRIMGQIVTTEPGLQGGNFEITNDESGLPKSDPEIDISPDGAFAVVWTDRRDGSQEVYLQGYDATDTPIGGNTRLSGIISTTANFQPTVSIADDHSGVAAWLAIDGGEQVIYYQHFDPDFNTTGANQLLPISYDGIVSDVGVYHLSGFDLTYFSYLRTVDEVQQVEVIALDESRAVLWGPIVINEALEASISDLRMAGSPSAIGVVWTDFRTGVERAWLQLVNLDGSLIMSNAPLSGLGEAAREMNPSLALGQSYYYSAWVDNRIPAEGYDVFAGNGEFTPTDAEDDDVALPAQLVLNQNYPNPFNPETVIDFSLSKAQRVRLTVFNSLGQRVRTLVDEWQPAGVHQVRWDGRSESGGSVASGVYFYRLETAEAARTRKMTLVK